MAWELTPDLEDNILSQLEEGISLVRICKQDDMPSRRTVLRWQRDNTEFGAKCVRAREAAGELAADELEQINELLLQGLLDPAAARVISSNKQWTASKLFSKKYGDSTTIKGDADNPIQLNLAARLDKAIEQIAVKPKTLDAEYSIYSSSVIEGNVTDGINNCNINTETITKNANLSQVKYQDLEETHENL